MRPEAKTENIGVVKRLLWKLFQVRLRFSRRKSWENWTLSFTGPEENLEETIRIGHDALANVDKYQIPPDEDHTVIFHHEFNGLPPP